VTGIGGTPRRPVVAEDIRNLQRSTGHGRRRLSQRPDLVAPALGFPAPLALWLR
jgi:hypothetical protein